MTNEEKKSYINEIKSLRDECDYLEFQSHLYQLNAMDYFVKIIGTLIVLCPSIAIFLEGTLIEKIIMTMILIATPFLCQNLINQTYGSEEHKRKKKIQSLKEEKFQLQKEYQFRNTSQSLKKDGINY